MSMTVDKNYGKYVMINGAVVPYEIYQRYGNRGYNAVSTRVSGMQYGGGMSKISGTNAEPGQRGYLMDLVLPGVSQNITNAIKWGMEPHEYIKQGWWPFPDEWEKYLYVDYSVDYEGLAEVASYGENIKTLTDLTGLENSGKFQYAYHGASTEK